MNNSKVIISKNVSIVPCLDIYAYHYIHELINMFDGIVNILIDRKIIKYGRNVIFYDKTGVKYFYLRNYIEIVNFLIQSCQAKIRSAPTLFIIPFKINECASDDYHLSIDISENIYHDEPIVLSIRIISNADNIIIWDELSDIMSDIVNLLGYRFHFSTLGFGFFSKMNINSFQEMKFFSMRFLGGMLFDPLCTNSSDAVYGLRSINWKMFISQHSLLEWGWVGEKGNNQSNVFFQTGDTPSICDRNIPTYELSEYIALNDKLKSIIYIPEHEWLPNMNSNEYERWAKRWGEITIK